MPYDARQPGGVQVHTLALSDALNAMGYQSKVFSPRKALRVQMGGTRADLSFHPSDLFRLRDFLRTPHDILHIQEPLLPAIGPLALLHPDAAPTVVTLHSAEPAASNFYRRAGPLLRSLLRHADLAICATDISRETAANILPNRVETIFPCLDLAPFSSVTRSPDPDTILFVGRDEPRKGLPILIRALDLLPDAQLVVAGPVSSATQRLADDRTTFLGPVPHEEIPSLLSTATCAAFPATGGEALGLVLIEAMAAGVPLAASDISGYRIASDHGRAALLSSPGDHVALAEQLKRLLTDSALRARLVASGQESADRFDARHIAEQHLALYRSLQPS